MDDSGTSLSQGEGGGQLGLHDALPLHVCASLSPLLAGASEKFFRIFEVDNMGVSVVTDVVDDPVIALN